MKNQRKENEKFSLAQFLRRKFLLLGALVCEVIALLMDKGTSPANTHAKQECAQSLKISLRRL